MHTVFVVARRLPFMAALAVVLGLGVRAAQAQTGPRAFMALSSNRMGNIRGEMLVSDHPQQFEIYAISTSPASANSSAMTITATLGLDAAPLLIQAMNTSDVLQATIVFERMSQQIGGAKFHTFSTLKAINGQLTSYSIGMVPGHPLAAVITLAVQKAMLADSAGAVTTAPVPTLTLPAPTSAERTPTLRGDQLQTVKVASSAMGGTTRGDAQGVVLDSLRVQLTHPVGGGQTTVSVFHFSTHADTAVRLLQQAEATGDSLKQTTLKFYDSNSLVAPLPYVWLQFEIYRGLLRPVALAGGSLARAVIAKPGATGSFDVVFPATLGGGIHALTITEPAHGVAHHIALSATTLY